MPAKKKLVSHAAKKLREAMVANLSNQIAAAYPGKATSAAYQKIAKATGMSLSTMQRVMSGETGPSIDTLADLAHHLGTKVPELLRDHPSGDVRIAATHEKAIIGPAPIATFQSERPQSQAPATRRIRR